MQVTLDTAKSYLRVDYDDEDELIQGLIDTAASYVAEISRAEVDETDAVVATAMLYAVAYLYEHRDEANHKELLTMLKNLLFPVRQEVF